MLVFIDESGHPRPKDSTKRPVLISVCIKETDVKRITNDIYKIKMDLYGKQDEIKSTDLIRRQTITKNRTINKEYVDRLINLIECSDTAAKDSEILAIFVIESRAFPFKLIL